MMHAWTLWSVGQINSVDVVEGLNAYDDSVRDVVDLMDGSRLVGNGGVLMIGNNR